MVGVGVASRPRVVPTCNGWEPTWPRPTWRACSAARTVVHLAWLIQPSHRPAEMWRTNVEGSTRVIEAVERRRSGDGPRQLHRRLLPGAFGRRVDESWPTEATRPWATPGRRPTSSACSTGSSSAGQTSGSRLRPALIFKREAAARIHSLFLGPMFPRWSLTTGLAPWVERSRRSRVVHTFDAAQAFRHAVERDVRGAFKRGDRTSPGRGRAHHAGCGVRREGALWRAVEGTHASGRAGLGTDGGDGPAPRYHGSARNWTGSPSMRAHDGARAPGGHAPGERPSREARSRRGRLNGGRRTSAAAVVAWLGSRTLACAGPAPRES